ncbi:hypothetical protein [Mucilaginibacter polytrichastri]|uniref:Uncharacterized protein n=1 Tax=Mucilaginibacter polytrichastri TaxID=1302689 RepID=A0A1Q5ZZS9_9SPHI|nr:hypothetical protein [Mucilaginibacter polytrichastri]OKS87274.1 hypothetical protein RG47T_2733 [Mucilaginibacter polytrichastri]SFT18597.1 hypothetical protein SAMN04487890_11527 [Mucilaginibacter polytrichastri]
MKYNIDLCFEQIKLPPFQDILILAKNSPQGKIGLSRSFELLLPNGFEMLDVEDELIDAVFVQKNILHKVSAEKVINILRQHVFPFISEGEIIRVDFKVSVSVQNIKLQD